MSIVHVYGGKETNGPVRLNRMDLRRPPYLSDPKAIAQANARQETPNGASYSNVTGPLPGPTGSQSGMPQKFPPMDFGPNQARSGE